MQPMQNFGPTANAHQNFMGVIWCPAANVAVFIAQYSYRRYPFFIHALFGLFVFFFSLSTAIPILATTGIVSSNSSIVVDFMGGSNLSSHYIVGITCLVAITIETALGIMTKVINLKGGKSSHVILSKWIHQIFGITILTLCKANVYVISPNSYGYMAQDALFFVLYAVWKLKYPKMETVVNPKHEKIEDLPQVVSLSKLSKYSHYCVFANMVYDLSAVKLVHPGGYEVIDSVKNRQIDRYIYGMYSSQFLPNIPKHSHSAKFYSLLGPPIARIAIAAPFSGLEDRDAVVGIETLELVSEEGGIYQMKLRRTDGKDFVFEGYTSIQQLGRYYSLTYGDKNRATRLYTSVNFLLRSNKMFIEKTLKFDKSTKTAIIKPKKGDAELTEYPIDKTMLEENQWTHCIPILFKMYKKGKFTEAVVRQCNTAYPTFTLSEPKGEGLLLGEARPGKIILIAGGTGIYPFSDLIDLLFKELLLQLQPDCKHEIYHLSPLLKQKSFHLFSFHLMGAFRHTNDIHPITLQQLFYLSKHHPRFDFIAKISSDSHPFQGTKIKHHKGSFGNLLKKQLQEKDKISKVYVCGPPKMNQELSQICRHLLEQQLYAIM